jgi:hypothetical protein
LTTLVPATTGLSQPEGIAFDAAAFFIGVLASGGITSASSLRLLLAVCVLFFVAPLTASKARSLRRKYKEGLAYVVDRAGDFVIAALVAAYGVEKLVSGLKPLSSLELPVSAHAATLAMAVLAAVIARYLMETAVVHCYPYRLSEVAMEKAPAPTALQRHLSTVFQTFLFVFVAMPVFGRDLGAICGGPGRRIHPQQGGAALPRVADIYGPGHNFGPGRRICPKCEEVQPRLGRPNWGVRRPGSRSTAGPGHRHHKLVSTAGHPLVQPGAFTCSRASRAQKLWSPTFQVPPWSTAMPVWPVSAGLPPKSSE